MPPRLRKRARKTNQPSSNTNWFDLPAEMRLMVIDQMGPKTRCNFAKCSKICEKEAKMSKKYLTKIHIGRKENAILLIGHGTIYFNYCLEFIDVGDLSEAQSIVVYKTEPKVYRDYEENMTARVMKWMKIEQGNAEDVRIRYLDGFIKKYGRGITGISIADNEFPFDKYNLRNLKNLNYIGEKINADIFEKGFYDLSQVLRSDCVRFEGTKLSFEQVLQFKGTELTIKSDDFDEKNVSKYLKMWKNGELSSDMKVLDVYHEEPREFNERNVMEGLNVFDYQQDYFECSFKFRLSNEKNEQYYCRVIYDTDHFEAMVKDENEWSSDFESDYEMYLDLDSDIQF